MASVGTISLFLEPDMQTNRRQFLSRSAIGGLGLVAAPLLPLGAAGARGSSTQAAEPPILASMSRYYRFSPKDEASREEVAWVQIDLGATRQIDAIRLRPAEGGMVGGHLSPIRFCIDCSDDPAIGERQPLVVWRAEHSADPENFLARFPTAPVNARYIRVEASAEASASGAMLASRLAAIEILSGGVPLSLAVPSWKANPRRGMMENHSA